MPQYEFRVLPAPRRGIKDKGAKTTEERFARALEQAMNEMGAQGWDYVRSDILPCEERQGLTGKATTYQTVLVFRREVGLAAAPAPQSVPVHTGAPAAAAPAAAPPVAAAPAQPAPFPRFRPMDPPAPAAPGADDTVILPRIGPAGPRPSGE